MYMYIPTYTVGLQSVKLSSGIQTGEEARLRRRRERRAADSSEEREMRLVRRRVADRARYAANSDGRTERRRERRAAESSEQRET